MYNFEQSAGNQRIGKNIQVGTSETTRGPRNIFRRRYSPWNKNSLIRHYSTSNIKKEDNTKNLNPLITYDNFKEDKVNILKEQKDKSGVYCLINKINGHS